MKRAFILTIFLFALLICQFASGEMIINQQPNKLYNLGDSVNVPITVKTITGVSGTFSMDLLCGSKQINFYKNGVNLQSGEEVIMDASLVLTKELLGENVGTCKIKGILGGEYIITNEFEISNLLILQPNTQETEFEPGKSILIFGDAVKENGQPANGFIDLEMVIANASENNIIQRGTINNGVYSINITLPQNMKAGKYLVKLNAYEVALDSSKTNKGFINYNIEIKQIPTSLELIFDEEEVKPGTDVRVKAILHDQSGEKIDSTAIITIKRGTSEIINGGGPSEKPTGEYMELPIAYNEPPGNWTVFALSNQLTAEARFFVIENEELKAEMINDTVLLTNIGNIPYNKSIIVKIGNASQPFDLFLEVDETKVIKLDASEGEHEVEIIDNEGESKLKETMTFEKSRLTGDAIQIRSVSQNNLGDFFKRPLVWIFLILILMGVVFIVLRRIRKKNPSNQGVFKNKIGIFKKKVKQPKVNTAWENRAIPLSKKSKLKTENKAKLVLSIRGNKQDVSVMDITIRNLGEVQEKGGNSEEPLQKIINLAENKKGFVYENQNTLFFIFAPSRTKTFQNESTAFELAQTAKEILSNYNKIAKYKLDFGISLEVGSIVERTENGFMEFMSLGILMSNLKKIASASQEEVLLGERIRGKLTNVRTEKYDNGRIVFYKIKDIKYYDEGHSRYIKSFLVKARENKENVGIANVSKKTDKDLDNTDSDKDDKNKDPKSLIKGFY